VAIATVLAIDPEVILLDEPTANLDPRSRDVLLDLLISLTHSGKTVITTTHELDVVPYISQRVVVFGDRRHRPVADGPPAIVLAATDVLAEANLIHVHVHTHGTQRHSHAHWHDDDHRNTQHSHEAILDTSVPGETHDA
jgi:cobalt/nickel transport system ATP-binding protein